MPTSHSTCLAMRLLRAPSVLALIALPAWGLIFLNGDRVAETNMLQQGPSVTLGLEALLLCWDLVNNLSCGDFHLGLSGGTRCMSLMVSIWY